MDVQTLTLFVSAFAVDCWFRNTLATSTYCVPIFRSSDPNVN